MRPRRKIADFLFPPSYILRGKLKIVTGNNELIALFLSALRNLFMENVLEILIVFLFTAVPKKYLSIFLTVFDQL